eukprot:TRINITY_DN6112_c0_g1_i1.p1 TRINITY_DN6112_c0_g1~~TRINITY_DN6112_c0_g1_i1.p1  ORF type:complete len:579 (+),score=103.55 TRINITY_DN6112_c0_g1_i1:85-1737(+)
MPPGAAARQQEQLQQPPDEPSDGLPNGTAVGRVAPVTPARATHMYVPAGETTPEQGPPSAVDYVLAPRNSEDGSKRVGHVDQGLELSARGSEREWRVLQLLHPGGSGTMNLVRTAEQDGEMWALVDNSAWVPARDLLAAGEEPLWTPPAGASGSAARRAAPAADPAHADPAPTDGAAAAAAASPLSLPEGAVSPRSAGCPDLLGDEEDGEPNKAESSATPVQPPESITRLTTKEQFAAWVRAQDLKNGEHYAKLIEQHDVDGEVHWILLADPDGMHEFLEVIECSNRRDREFFQQALFGQQAMLQAGLAPRPMPLQPGDTMGRSAVVQGRPLPIQPGLNPVANSHGFPLGWGGLPIPGAQPGGVGGPVPNRGPPPVHNRGPPPVPNRGPMGVPAPRPDGPMGNPMQADMPPLLPGQLSRVHTQHCDQAAEWYFKKTKKAAVVPVRHGPTESGRPPAAGRPGSAAIPIVAPGGSAAAGSTGAGAAAAPASAPAAATAGDTAGGRRRAAAKTPAAAAAGPAAAAAPAGPASTGSLPGGGVIVPIGQQQPAKK